MAELAQRQHGAVSTAQLHAAGVGRGAVERRVRRGRLHRVHRGVYAVGHPRLTGRGRLWAAVLACGGVGVAVLSHRAAAAVWDLRPLPGTLDVTTLRRSVSTRTLRLHSSKTLDPLDDVVRQPDGLPVTAVARTLVDLAAVLTAHQIERTCHRAEFLRRLDTAAIGRILQRAPARGARNLRAALATLATAEPDVTRSELEERFLALVAQAGLQQPRVNTRVAGHEVDFVWRAARLVVEVDGVQAHLTPVAFERDRRRDVDLQLAGFHVLRFTRRRIATESHAVVRALAAALL